MADTLPPRRLHLLSSHTSNPLQVGSSDSMNARYLSHIGPYLDPKAPAKSEGVEEDDEEVLDDGHDDNDNIAEEDDQVLYMQINDGDDGEVGESVSQAPFADDGEDTDTEPPAAPQSDPVWASKEESSEEAMWDDDEEAEDDDEENSLARKSLDEQVEIRKEMQDLEESVEELSDGYRLVDRLGEGTFSSVYKAEDLKCDEHFNNYWLGHHPLHSSAHYQSLPPRRNGQGKAYVAIKRIYVTSSPARIENEIALMEDLRGCRHVAQLMTAFRTEDQVVAIMPFHRNQDFRTFYRILPLPQMQNYFRCLFRALKDIHAREIIHRDIKPANFLYDPVTQVGTLVDFGLAQRVYAATQSPRCLHSHPSREFPHGWCSKHDTSARIVKARSKFAEAHRRAMQPPERIGYPTDDSRSHVRANRAGTRGFRAPEVLLKCPDQTVAIDVWSAGVILLSFLTGKFPVFNSNDDVEALMEIATIFGKEQMERCAYLHSRSFLTNVPDIEHKGVAFKKLVRQLNPSLFDSPTTDQSLLRDVLDLLHHTLALDCTHRITSAGALEHPFLLDPSQPEHTVVPHLIGEGACGKAHWVDDMDGSHCIRVDGRVIRITAGEGVPIGTEPCEIHKERGWTDEGPGSDHGVYDL